MKKTLLGLCAVVMLTSAGLDSASAIVINDDYIGSEDHGWGDRIGTSRYEISNMEVTFNSGYMNVRVNTNFNASGDPYGIDFGDLFISTNGWNPNGTAPYLNDNASNGESWEFVFDTSENMLYGDGFTLSLSDDILGSGLTYRNGQEVQRNDSGTALAGSNVNLADAGTGGYVEYNILLSSLGLVTGDIGLKWSMTCANDSIEGAVDVPEPSALLLFSVGLLGLGAVARKKKS
ncbi:MAG: PEP-CTERM sorting domain-containing protein [Proteobacteria bacterium]|nr:PEP-CTERM sorting domain-containing protein [Pseudomonadota bacterium]